MLANRNFKVNAYIGLTTHATMRYTTVLDTGAGSSFIKESCLPPGTEKLIKPLHSAVRIKDANNRALVVAGRINLSCQIGSRKDIVTFYVVDRLATDVILGCDYCDRHIEAIKPRKRLVELDDGTTVPIVRRPDKRKNDSVPLPDEQVYAPAKGRINDKITTFEEKRLEPDTQTWVKVVTNTHGLIQVESLPKLYTNQLCMIGNGIAQVIPGKSFKILVANIGHQPITLLKGQKIARAEPHPTSVVESDIMLAEMLGIAEEEPSTDVKMKNTYRKRPGLQSGHDAELINKHLADLRESHMEQDEKPVTAEDIPLDDVDPKYHETIRRMLKKHEQMWLGQLGEINVTEHTIELKSDAKPFKSPPFRAGPKTRELEQFEINKQLNAGVIEPAQSEWAAPVLFVPKKDGRLRFCVDYRKLNEIIVRDSYPLPRMDECIDSLAEAKIFSTLDANSGYWQM